MGRVGKGSGPRARLLAEGRTISWQNASKSIVPPRAVNCPWTPMPIISRSSAGVGLWPRLRMTVASSSVLILPSRSLSKSLNAS